MLLDQGEGLADAGQHAERQHVDLEDAERVEIVLVPFDDGAVLHRRVLDRHQLVERPAGDDEAADMLREMAGKADQLAGEVERQAQGAVGGIEPGLAHPLVGDRARSLQPQTMPASAATTSTDRPRALPTSRIALRGAVADHRGGEAGAVAAVFLVDVLDHLLAPLMLEIDVDIGRLVARGADEALEQDVDARGIDRGDAEAIADGGIGRRAAALAEDAAAAGRTRRCRAR